MSCNDEEPWIDQAEYFTGMSWADWRLAIAQSIVTVTVFISVPNYLWSTGPHGWFKIWSLIYIVLGLVSAFFAMIGVRKVMEA